jgi:DNA-binding NarL/FixJ family response regulator
MAPLGKIIKIVIADGQTLVREGLESLFQSEKSVEVIGTVENGREAVDRALILDPDVIVMDSLMPIMNAAAATRRIKSLNCRSEVLILSATHSEETVREAFESGARAYLIKDCQFSELVEAIKKAAHGDFYISSVAGPDMVAAYVNTHLQSQRPGGLMTPREQELARLLADGYSTKEAADILNISPKTAETHRASIMKKLKARNVTDIVKYCIRNRIIQI